MTRQDILEAAAQLIHEKGFHAASMRDIADAVNMRKASLYHHVTSKQDILLEILDQALDLLIENMQAVMNAPLTPEEKIRRAIDVYIGTLTEHRDIASVLLFEHRSLSDTQQNQHIARRDQFEGLWRDLIKQGSDIGAFHVQDASITAKSLLGTLNWTITWYRPEGSLSAAQIANQISDLFLCGIKQGGDA
jgi:AcrR family transcriptional regulator